MEELEKTVAQLKEEAEAQKWRNTVIEGQRDIFDEMFPNSEAFLASLRQAVERPETLHHRERPAA